MHKKRRFNLIIAAAALVVALAAAVLVSCEKTKASFCEDCYKPNLQELQQFADFAGKCHNSALDMMLPIAESYWQRGEIIDTDSILL